MTTATISRLRPNFTIARIGKVSVAYSYDTPIGVKLEDGPWCVRINEWGPTTGKHLNHLDQGTTEAKQARVTEAFLMSYLDTAVKL